MLVTGVSERVRPVKPPSHRWMARTSVAAIGTSVGCMAASGIAGPRAGSAAIPPAPPWPPWFVHAYPSAMLWSILLWLAELLGFCGLVMGLVAARRGWRPKHLIFASVVAITALMVIPPVDNGDPLMYAAFGRISVLGHSPYVMTPGQLRISGDPVGAVVPSVYWNLPSRYGPVATWTETAASELAGDSAARTTFWIKVWNALAYLVVVLALDRVARSDPAQRVRAHLLWSLNPLMLFSVMANGHNDVLAVAAGAWALLTLQRVDLRRALIAGALLGVATAVKAPYALFGVGLAWTARRSPRALTALALGAAAVLVPSYLLAGRAAISATAGLATTKPDLLWLDVARLIGWQHAAARVNIVALIGSGVLAMILLWRMPPGPRTLPAVRIALGLALGLLLVSPYQTAWYDVMIFPLLAAMPASRLDWIVAARAAALSVASAPFFSSLNPAWVTVIERISIAGSPTLAVGAVDAVLLWFCCTRNWNSADSDRNLFLGQAPAEIGGVPSTAG
jgi:hypothetical protein